MRPTEGRSRYLMSEADSCNIPGILDRSSLFGDTRFRSDSVSMIPGLLASLAARLAWARRRPVVVGAAHGMRRVSSEVPDVFVCDDGDVNGVDFLGGRSDAMPKLVFGLLVLDGFPHVRGCGCSGCFCCCCCC